MKSKKVKFNKSSLMLVIGWCVFSGAWDRLPWKGYRICGLGDAVCMHVCTHAWCLYLGKGGLALKSTALGYALEWRIPAEKRANLNLLSLVFLTQSHLWTGLQKVLLFPSRLWPKQSQNPFPWSQEAHDSLVVLLKYLEVQKSTFEEYVEHINCLQNIVFLAFYS